MSRLRRRAPFLLGLLLATASGCASTAGPGEEDLPLLVRILIGLGFTLGVLGIGWVNRENQ